MLPNIFNIVEVEPAHVRRDSACAKRVGGRPPGSGFHGDGHDPSHAPSDRPGRPPCSTSGLEHGSRVQQRGEALGSWGAVSFPLVSP